MQGARGVGREWSEPKHGGEGQRESFEEFWSPSH